jgi:hypothetical protein
MELVQRRFDDLSRVQYTVFICAFGGKHNSTALVLNVLRRLQSRFGREW